MPLTPANPLLRPANFPAFAEIRADHVAPAVRKTLQELRAERDRLVAEPKATAREVLALHELVSERLGWVWGTVEHLLSVCDREDLRKAHDDIQGEVVDFGLEIGQDPVLFAKLEAAKSTDSQADAEWSRMSPAEQRALDQLLLSARLSGVALKGADKQRFSEIEQQLADLSTQFSHHVLDATKAWHLDLSQPEEVAGLPDSWLQLAHQSWQAAHPQGEGDWQRGPWRLNLDTPSQLPFLQHAKRRDLRETSYRAYITRASSGELDNGPLIQRILALRAEQAALLGFASYADLSIASKMAPSAASVHAMLQRLREASWPQALVELEELRSLAREMTAGEGADEAADLRPWDVAFWAERLREQRYAYSEEELRPWLPLPTVLNGVFSLAQRLFGVQIAAADGEAPVWHPDVRFFRVLTESGKPMAAFYLDPYSRPAEKRGGAWMNECLGRSARAGEPGQPRLPVAYLICNSTPPVGDQPSLLTFGEVETLLHEFGHGLQHMLTQVDEGLVSGIRGIEWDAVELPSQFMENWAYHRPTLRSLTGHVTTGEPLPDALFAKVAAARTFRAASAMLRQILFAWTDLALHSQAPVQGDPLAVFAQVAALTSPLPPLPEDRFLNSFQHIFAGGYAAGYYSYKWAEVLSADAFGAFEEADLENEAEVARLGRRFRDTVLALGGSAAPSAVFKEFRGREPSEEALLRHFGLSR